MGEFFFESFPQLATLIGTVRHHCENCGSGEEDDPDGGKRIKLLLTHPSMTAMQIVCLVSSLLAASTNLVSYLATHRRHLINDRFPIAASKIPLFCFFLSGVLSSTFHFAFLPYLIQQYISPYVKTSPPPNYLPCILWLLTVLPCMNFFSSLVTLFIPKVANSRWRMFGLCLHILFHGAVFAGLIFAVVDDASYQWIAAAWYSDFYFDNYALIVFCGSCFVHFFLGIFIFSSVELAQRAFTLALISIVGILHGFTKVFCSPAIHACVTKILYILLSNGQEMREIENVLENGNMTGDVALDDGRVNMDENDGNDDDQRNCDVEEDRDETVHQEQDDGVSSNAREIKKFDDNDDDSAESSCETQGFTYADVVGDVDENRR